MPIYEYQCKKCGARTEAMQKLTDKPLTKCRKCGGRLEKLMSAPAIQFKGAGWYVTDYADKKGEAKEETKGASEEKRSASSEISTSAEKPATKEGAKKGSKKTSTTSSGD